MVKVGGGSRQPTGPSLLSDDDLSGGDPDRIPAGGVVGEALLVRRKREDIESIMVGRPVEKWYKTVARMTTGRRWWSSEGHVDSATAGRESEGTNVMQRFPDRILEAANIQLKKRKRRSLSTSSK